IIEDQIASAEARRCCEVYRHTLSPVEAALNSHPHRRGLAAVAEWNASKIRQVRIDEVFGRGPAWPAAKLVSGNRLSRLHGLDRLRRQPQIDNVRIVPSRRADVRTLPCRTKQTLL